MTTSSLALDGTRVDLGRLAEVCRRYGVVELSLFGSTARGNAVADSDIDLLYVLAPHVTLGFSLNRLEDELAEVFGRPVDLVSKRSLHPLLQDDVLADARVVYAA